MSDDQGKHLGLLNYQPAVQKHFIEQGTAFEKHFCTQSQCCPSRVSCRTGKHSHSTNVTNVLPPFGGYPKFGPVKFYPGEYSTDLVSEKSVEFLDEAAESSRRFLLFGMPIGPHGQVWFPNATNPGIESEPPVVAEPHNTCIRTQSLGRPDGRLGLGSKLPQTLPRQNQTVVDYWDEFYRLRLRSLASVDDMINSIMSGLESHNLLDDTYVIYTSDNGFHIGRHCLQPGKTNCYEEDVNVPFFIRGPGVARDATVPHPTSHIDLTPTILDPTNTPLTRWIPHQCTIFTRKEVCSSATPHRKSRIET
ncbi:alkaline-phosphatase-like protein [Coniochaeta sp. 2T2.1]|nr:alkaline-phosphatase-like protein [Coniochaeta sp. 2T2.1]